MITKPRLFKYWIVLTADNCWGKQLRYPLGSDLFRQSIALSTVWKTEASLLLNSQRKSLKTKSPVWFLDTVAYKRERFHGMPVRDVGPQKDEAITHLPSPCHLLGVKHSDHSKQILLKQADFKERLEEFQKHLDREIFPLNLILSPCCN